jgi:predicted DNA-binding transcriptional regulator AlpA
MNAQERARRDRRAELIDVVESPGGARPSTARLFLDERELASLLNVGLSTVQKWRSRGRGEGPPFVKLTPGFTGLVRYSVSDVERWIGERTKTKSDGREPHAVARQGTPPVPRAARLTKAAR